jgi:hypothetical protein
MDTSDRGVSDEADSSLFMRLFLLHSDEIDGILIACFPLRCLIWMDSIPRR